MPAAGERDLRRGVVDAASAGVALPIVRVVASAPLGYFTSAWDHRPGSFETHDIFSVK
jgi:hypothetical protein